MSWIIVLISSLALAVESGPMPSPVFLKQGYSSILEFDEAPTQVVLGDSEGFQVEKLGKSIVLRPLTNYASTNMFVYFKADATKLFVLTASEEAEPTYYRRVTRIIPKPESKSAVASSIIAKPLVRGSKITKSAFDSKRDYLTLDLEITADSRAKRVPDWSQIRLKHKSRFIRPQKLWSERKEAQKDSKIRARLIFAKPNVPEDFRDVSLLVPMKGELNTTALPLRRGSL